MIQLPMNNENSDSGSNSLSDYPIELIDENNIFTTLGIIIIFICSVCAVMLFCIFCEICRNNIRRNHRFRWNNINRDVMIL